MPISINVGLSRKASRDYQSAGVSINVTAELDQSLLAKPDELQAQVANLYAQAGQALEQQACGMSLRRPSRPTYDDRRPSRSNGNRGSANGNHPADGNGDGHARGNGTSGMTDSQRRAINAIARRLNIDPAYEAEQVLGAPLDDLSVRQASELIDHLKAIQPNSNGNER